MRIGIDATPLTYNLTGVGRYVFELCRHLPGIIPNAIFYLYSRDPIKNHPGPGNWICRHEASSLWQRVAKNALWLKMRCGSMANQDNVDVFWSPCFILPGGLRPNIRTVLTVHDLVVDLYPETVLLSQIIRHKLFFKSDLTKCDVLVTNSAGTQKRIFEKYGRMAECVVKPGVSDHFCHRSMEEIDKCKKLFGIKGSYFLSVATLEPRKNLEVLVDAFLELRASGRCFDYKLVLVGGMGWKNQSLLKKINNNVENGILPLGYVEDRWLPALYSGAHLFIYPSSYEGFGMPVAEAIACGSRVVASDTMETKEAGGDSAFYVSPTKDEIIRKILGIALIGDQGKIVNFPPYDWRWSEQARVLARVFTGITLS